MSFGFGVGDFVTVSSLTIALYKAFKNAPVEFVEISHQLQSLHIVIAELKEQAEEEKSPLNQNGARCQRELFEIRDNLLETMQELEDLHKRYKRMGRISWSRFQLGQENLAAMRGKLIVQVSALNAFMGCLTLGALGRMEPMLQRIHQLLDERARGSITAAQSVLSAMSDRQEDWQRLELELRMEGIPLEYMRDNREQIRAVLSSVVQSNHLEGYDSGIESGQTTRADAPDNDSVLAEDSASQVQGRPQNESGIQNRGSHREAPDLQNIELRNRTPKRPIIARKSLPTRSERGQLSTSEGSKTVRPDEEVSHESLPTKPEKDQLSASEWSKILTPEEETSRKSLSTKSKRSKFSTTEWLKTLTPDEEDSRMLLMNQGFDVRRFRLLKHSRPRKTPFEKLYYLKDNRDAVCWAATTGNDAALRLLLNNGCHPSSQGCYPSGSPSTDAAIYWAVKYQKWSCVWLLLNKGADVNIDGFLSFAVDTNNLNLVERIVRKGVSVGNMRFDGWLSKVGTLQKPNKIYWAPLHNAAYSQSSNMVEFLLGLGANIEISTPTGQRPLGISLRYSNRSEEPLQVVKSLLKYGAFINHVDRDGKTALALAISGNHPTVARLLLDRGADVNHMDQYGQTALHLVASKYRPGYTSLAKLLLERGADVNAQLARSGFRDYGNTPLHKAVNANCPIMMDFLLGKGANMKARGPTGANPLQLVEALPLDSEAQEIFRKYN